MKAVQVSTPDGPEALELSTVPEPVYAAGEVLIEVRASGVNFIDVYHRTGVYPMQTPFIPGLEGAGVVAAVGAEVRDFQVGDRVAWAQVPGSYAQRVVAGQDALVAIPDGVDDETAAAVMLQGLTAHYLSQSVYRVQPGELALVHAAAGGVGLLLTQMIKRRGGRVLATASTAHKAELARRAGAEKVFGYQDFAERIAELTGGEGVSVSYDGVGKATVDGSLSVLRPRGMFALFGQSSGMVEPMDPQRLARGGSLFMTRPVLAHYVADVEEYRARTTEVFDWITQGDLSVHIGGRYRLDNVVAAHRDLEGRVTTGKLLLFPGEIA